MDEYTSFVVLCEVVHFLEGKWWGGVAGVFTVLTFCFSAYLAFARNRQNASNRLHIGWVNSAIAGRFFVWVAIIAAIFGIAYVWRSWGYLYGLIALFGTLYVYVLSDLRDLHKRMVTVQTELEIVSTENATQSESLRRIISVHNHPYRIARWEVDHYIDKNGDGKTIEEQVIYGEKGNLHFRRLLYSASDHAIAPEDITLIAYNAQTDVQTRVVQKVPRGNGVEYMLLLDPPATAQQPFHLKVEVLRKNLWHQLIQTGADTAQLIVYRKTNNLQVRFHPHEDIDLGQVTALPHTSGLSVEPLANGQGFVVTSDKTISGTDLTFNLYTRTTKSST